MIKVMITMMIMTVSLKSTRSFIELGRKKCTICFCLTVNLFCLVVYGPCAAMEECT